MRYSQRRRQVFRFAWIMRCSSNNTPMIVRVKSATALRSAPARGRLESWAHLMNSTFQPASLIGRAGYFAYNFIKIHRTLRTSPAMAAGVTNRLWEVSDLVALLEAERGLERAA
jgi:hypothetical protein